MRPQCVPSARELALDPERWAVRTPCERGSTKQLPDLAVWLTHSSPPIALVAESGGRREDRQKWILEGWNGAIYAGQYSAGPLRLCERFGRALDPPPGQEGTARAFGGSTPSSRRAQRRSPLSPPPPMTRCRPKSSAENTESRPRRAKNKSRSNPLGHPSPCAGGGERPSAPSQRRNAPRHPRRLRSASVAIARSSASPSQSRAGDGDAELSTNAPHDFCSPRWHRKLAAVRLVEPHPARFR